MYAYILYMYFFPFLLYIPNITNILRRLNDKIKKNSDNYINKNIVT